MKDIDMMLDHGLTGLAQVNGRNTTGWNSRFKYDLEYIENLSFINDLKIIMKTLKKVIYRENVLSGNALLFKSLDEERKCEIRKLTYEDVIENEKVLKTYIKELREEHFFENIEDEVQRIYSNMIEFTRDRTASILGLFILSELKGFIWGYEANNETMHVNYFFVNKAYRRFGFGKKLITELEKSTTSNIELLTNKTNEGGLKFYINNDFKIIEENDKTTKLLYTRN